MLAPSFDFGARASKNALRVLLVENDDVDARIVALTTGLMSEYALSIRRASDLAGAERAIADEPFDLFLIDFWLGEETTLRLLPVLEAKHPKAAIIVLSNIRLEEAEKLRLCARRAVLLAKASLSPERLEWAINKA